MNEKLHKAYQQLLDTKKTFQQKLDKCSDEQQRFQPAEGSWNMLEVWEHILISESLIISHLKKNPPAETKYKTTFKSNIAYALLAKLYTSSTQVKMPLDTLSPKGQSNYSDLETISDSNNNFLLETIQSFPEDKIKYSVFKHTVSGPMTMEQTIVFFKNHIKHHIHQLNRIQKHSNYPKN